MLAAPTATTRSPSAREEAADDDHHVDHSATQQTVHTYIMNN